jgi:NitT/TauT family transport system substrate-binding protein
VYAQDRNSGIKLLAAQAWFVRNDDGEVSAFLLKGQANDWAKSKGGKVLDFNAVRSAVLASK